MNKRVHWIAQSEKLTINLAKPYATWLPFMGRIVQQNYLWHLLDGRSYKFHTIEKLDYCRFVAHAF